MTESFVIYIVRNDGVGAFGTATHDMTCGPTECLWMIPEMEQSNCLKPGESSPSTAAAIPCPA